MQPQTTGLRVHCRLRGRCFFGSCGIDELFRSDIVALDTQSGDFDGVVEVVLDLSDPNDFGRVEVGQTPKCLSCSLRLCAGGTCQIPYEQGAEGTPFRISPSFDVVGGEANVLEVEQCGIL